jgi:hypothetical protein
MASAWTGALEIQTLWQLFLLAQKKEPILTFELDWKHHCQRTFVSSSKNIFTLS